VTGLDAVFFEPGLGNMPPGRPNAGMENYRYEWASMRAALDAMPSSSDGARRRRYVDPVHGGAIMPTIDCDALSLQPGRETRPFRTTSSAICFVVEGEGHSTVGNERIAWRKNDIFTLPHWQWATHHASVPSYMIVTSNRELMLRLGLLITETEEGGVRRRSRSDYGTGGKAEDA
jgi:gentisate 1,2-dioxygenase